MLETYIRTKRREKTILLMTHLVIGYPSFEESFRVVETMVNAGVDLIELQIPFSEPVADGPIIVHANQNALAGGATVQRCLDFSKEVACRFHIPFLIMSYYNLLFKYGTDRFVSFMASARLDGAIIPDLPPEEGGAYLKAMNECDLNPIFIFSPTTPPDRLKYIDSIARGFIYCVSRKGVTGDNTKFVGELDLYLDRCRRASHLPIALGFGLKNKSDIDFLTGKIDIAVIGSQAIKSMNEEGIDSLGHFIRGLR